jgi:hypothetical protein
MTDMITFVSNVPATSKGPIANRPQVANLPHVLLDEYT